jgi:hypothetical protein
MHEQIKQITAVVDQHGRVYVTALLENDQIFICDTIDKSWEKLPQINVEEESCNREKTAKFSKKQP